MPKSLFNVPQGPLAHFDPAPGSGFSGDIIEIEILENGVIKITTDPVSGPNHTSAESLLRTIAEIAGGETVRARRHRVTHGTQKQHNHTHQKN